MAHLHDSQLNRFGLEPERLQLAKSLLHTAQLRTGSGSGHELDKGAAGLPAICAYIACKRYVRTAKILVAQLTENSRLNSTEVDLKSAQTASCLRSHLFKKTLEKVESVLKESPAESPRIAAPSSPQKSRPNAYTKLLETHKFRRNVDVLLTWLVDAEKALLTSGELRANEIKKLKDSQLLSCAVFGWTCAVFKV
jgi:hypothetical protein